MLKIPANRNLSLQADLGTGYIFAFAWLLRIWRLLNPRLQAEEVKPHHALVSNFHWKITLKKKKALSLLSFLPADSRCFQSLA
jgi:hypothetical protein